ncbi:lysylphosphatidylglycerol synthase domain-containing protein, partial [Segeticoccus rhizosphaerae]
MARRSLWSWARPVVGLAILGAVAWRLGTEALLAPLQRLDGPPMAAAMLLAALSTVCAAWRWRWVSAGLGSELPLRTAVAAYYRSQFLNLVLPGGVLGDVHRAVRRGHDVGDLPHAARAVVGERCAGQLVQLVMTVVVLLVLPSPVRDMLPTVLIGLVLLTGAAVAVWALAGHPAAARGRVARGVRRVVGP